jgi:hypothetical protein
MIFSSLPCIGWFWPRDPSHGFKRLTWIGLGIYFFPDPWLQLFFMISSFYKVISISSDRSWVSQVSLDWLELILFLFFSIYMLLLPIFYNYIKLSKIIEPNKINNPTLGFLLLLYKYCRRLYIFSHWKIVGPTCGIA